MMNLADRASILDCEQGGEEWLTARLGIPTGSKLSTIITKTGKLSTQANAYMSELIAEDNGIVDNGFKSFHMERGNELEPTARKSYEFMTDNKVIEVGGVYYDERKSLMISPDGLMPELRKGLEIKCPMAKTHIKYMIEGKVPDEYLIQIMSGLMVTGYDTWDFVSFCPELERNPIYILTVQRDEELIRKIEKACNDFVAKLDKIKKQF